MGRATVEAGPSCRGVRASRSRDGAGVAWHSGSIVLECLASGGSVSPSLAPNRSPRRRRLVPLALAAVLLLGAGVWFVVRLLHAPLDWQEDWTAPPGFSQAILDLSSGRFEEGERSLENLFTRYRSPVWRRRASLAIGVSRLRRRQFPAALDSLAQAERGGGPLLPFVALRKAEALTGSRKPREAADLLERASRTGADPVLVDDLAIARAGALAAAGDRPAALRALEGHLASSACRDSARVMEAAAKTSKEAGDPDAALGFLRRIYFEEPRSSEAARAATKLAAVVPSSRRFGSSDPAAVVSRSRTLMAAGDGRAALATWDLFLSSVPATGLGASHRLDVAEAAIEAREHARALTMLGKPQIARGESRRGLLLARALFGLGRDTRAISALRNAAEGASPEAATSRFLLATGLDQNDHDREALDQFLRFIRDFRGDERMAPATWRAGWLAYRLGRREEARRLFQKLVDLPEAAAYHPSALYWLARSTEAAGSRTQAIDVYRRLVAGHTRDYYGLIAARRLDSLGVRASAANPASARNAEAPRDGAGGKPRGTSTLGSPSRAFCLGSRTADAAPRVLAGCELETIGFFQDAEREYEAAAARLADRSVLLRLSELALRKGDRAAAISRLKLAVPDYLAVPIESLPIRYWEVLYPRREWDRILEFSRARRLDPHVVCGLVLQESAFNPLAVSAAGAMGLMQVLPQTGRDAARATGVGPFTSARLFEPATNLRLGTWHFADLLARCDGRIELALAAYNAGEGRLRRWRTVFGTSDPTSFVEDVPFTETRLYVKRVLSHAAMYRAIYGD